jgi:hypothetical protein
LEHPAKPDGREADFNGFDGALCDAEEAFFGGLTAVLPNFFAGGRWALASLFLAGVFEPPLLTFPLEVLEDFLRVFLDIRLPFVAFDGSIMGSLLRFLSGRQRISPGCWVRLTAPEYGYKQFDATPVHSLNVPLGRNDE